MNHPYHPPGVPIPYYAPNVAPTIQLLGSFGAIAGAIVLGAWLAPGSKVRTVDRFSASWFALCGFLHVFFEGYYVYHRKHIAGMNTLFAQLWKEYTLSDSRYLTLDIFTVCVESITVVAWGPLCILTLGAIVTKHPLRHALQTILCTAHLYGVALYYLTNYVEGVSYSRPEVQYYWVYYVGLNAPWAVVPFWLLYDSFSEIHKAFSALGDREATRKAN